MPVKGGLLVGLLRPGPGPISPQRVDIRLCPRNIPSSPRTTERPVRERGDECSELPARVVPQSHGRLSAVAQAGKSVVRGSLGCVEKIANDPVEPGSLIPLHQMGTLIENMELCAGDQLKKRKSALYRCPSIVVSPQD